MSDEQLRIDIEDELLWEPRIDDAGIEVAVENGTVTLRGQVPSFRELREATRAAKRVYGVEQVHNDLSVELLPGDRRDDRRLRKAISQALELDALVPPSVDATVRGGVVTLDGTASYQFQREQAELTAGNVTGVTWIDNAIQLVATSASSQDVKDWIGRALRRDALLGAAAFSVETAGRTVILSGTVGSWPEHDAALEAAWAAPGVAMVEDRIVVAY
jgi:osmotically-inducible protein OsmY